MGVPTTQNSNFDSKLFLRRCYTDYDNDDVINVFGKICDLNFLQILCAVFLSRFF